MRKLLLLISIVFIIPAYILGQSGKVFDNLSMTSKILKSERKYALYLPPDYKTSDRSYPVLYLLHGAGDDQTGWIQFGEVLRIADKAINSGKATPMIIVMPDANTGQRGYFNDPSNDWNYEDFFFEEFVPYIEKTYRIRAEKQYRAIAGLSMGGGGTFIYTLHHPEMFSSACPLSAYIGALSFENFKKMIPKNGKKINEPDLKSYYENHNALSLIKSMDKEQIESVHWFIDCGDDDFLYEGNSLVHMEMRKLDIPHEFRIRDGIHSWTYWRESLPVVLEFVSNHFHRH